LLKIDFFSHIRPAAYTEFVLTTLPTCRLQGLEIVSMFDVEVRRRVMDRFGVDMQVLTLASPLPDSLPLSGEEEMQACRVANQVIAEICERERGRFVGIGCVPMSQPELAVDVMREAVGELGLKGFQASSNIRGVPLDCERFTQIFDTAARLDVPVLIHPAFPTSYSGREYEKGYDLAQAFGWPFETSIAVARLVLSGLLEKHPDLKIVTHHLGGMIPYFIGRLEYRYHWREDPLRTKDWRVTKPPSQLFKKIYADTAIGGNRAAMRLAYEFFGAEKMLFGTDYPFGPKQGEVFIQQAIDVVEQESIPEEDRKKIFGENARRLLKM